MQLVLNSLYHFNNTICHCNDLTYAIRDFPNLIPSLDTFPGIGNVTRNLFNSYDKLCFTLFMCMQLHYKLKIYYSIPGLSFSPHTVQHALNTIERSDARLKLALDTFNQAKAAYIDFVHNSPILSTLARDNHLYVF